MTRLRKCNKCKGNPYKPDYMFSRHSDGKFYKTCKRCQYMNRYAHRENEPMLPYAEYHFFEFPNCEMCPFIDECRMLVNDKRPVLCEIEYWEIDEYFDHKQQRLDTSMVLDVQENDNRFIQSRLPMV